MKAIRYRIVPIDPAAHLFEVVCVIAEPATDGQMVSLPAWIPGSYMIRDFAKNILYVRAESNGKSIAMQKCDKDTWKVDPVQGSLELSYQVYAWELSVRAAHLDTSHGFFNGTSVFLRVHGQESQRCEVDIQKPEGDAYAEWRVATALPRLTAEAYRFGLYQAENYDELIDHPVEMGRFTLAAFDACGVSHAVAITGENHCDINRLCRDLKQICEYQIRFFGEPAPVEYYLFLVMVLPDGYGGLEHRASCSLMCARKSLPRHGDAGISDDYRDFLSLSSHEYFHTWNVKRIKPAAFTPYDLQKENYTRLLWAFEGMTSYYEDIVLVRCDLISIESFLELLGQKVTALLRSRGREIQSVTESSFDAWTKFYKQDENAFNAIVSYYVKGALIALSLDIQLRDISGGIRSLDDVMRLLWKRYGKTSIGVPEQGVEALIDEVADQKLTPLYEKMLYSTEELPLDAMLKKAGIALQTRTASHQKDRGGKAANVTQSPVSLAVRFADENGFAKLTHVINKGVAHKAGLAAGDVIIALGGLKVASHMLEESVSRYPVGARLEVHAFRRDELKIFQLELEVAEKDTAYLVLMDDPGESALKLRGAWLSSQDTN